MYEMSKNLFDSVLKKDYNNDNMKMIFSLNPDKEKKNIHNSLHNITSLASNHSNPKGKKLNQMSQAGQLSQAQSQPSNIHTQIQNTKNDKFKHRQTANLPRDNLYSEKLFKKGGVLQGKRMEDILLPLIQNDK